MGNKNKNLKRMKISRSNSNIHHLPAILSDKAAAVSAPFFSLAKWDMNDVYEHQRTNKQKIKVLRLVSWNIFWVIQI